MVRLPNRLGPTDLPRAGSRADMKANPLTSYIESVEMKTIRPSKNAVRSDVGSVSGLMSSIQDKGLLEPIVVRPINGGFEVVAGGRRYEACRKLGWRRVACHLVELDDKEAFEVSLLENIQRETLNPIEEGRAFRNYVEQFGYGGETELARRIGKSQAYVSRRIGLLSLPERVQSEIRRRHISPSVAQELTLLNDDDAEDVAEAIGSQKLSLREVRQIFRHGKGERDRLLASLAPFEQPGVSLSQRRTQRVAREVNKAIATLKVSILRLGEVAENLEDEWLIRETIFACRDSLAKQIDSLTRLRKKVERDGDSDTERFSVFE